MAEKSSPAVTGTKEAEVKEINTVSQEIVDEPTPKVSRRRTSPAVTDPKVFVKLLNTATGITNEMPAATAAKLNHKNRKKYQIVQ